MATTTIGTGDIEARVSSLGAQLVSLKRGDGEYLWQGDARWWTGHSPVLFPIVGSLRGEHAIASAGEVSLARHGLARRREFTLVEAIEDAVSFTLTSDDETRTSYPYDFALTMTYTATATSVEQRFRVENTGDVALPFVLGGHPAFNVPAPGDEGADFSDYQLEFVRRWTYASPTLEITSGLWDFDTRQPLLNDDATLPLTHRTFDVDTIVFEGVPDNTIRLVGPSGHGMRVDFDGFDYLGVWSAAGDAPFVALEPWVGPATAFDEDDTFEHKRGMQLLEPGAAAEYAFTMTPL